MNKDLNPVKGFIYGVLLSLPFWLIVLIVLALLGVFGG
jgi:hypothetical protein